MPENHIVIDFDIPDENGNKCFDLNLAEASKWPPTYAEVSKGGQGIHLHYIYTGDPTRLSRIYDDHIEVKVFTGKSSLRRKLTKFNNLPIATISSGLPLKGESSMVNNKVVQSEKGLRVQIKRNLNKEIHPATKPSIDFIHKILTDAYESGMVYDVTDMRNAVLAFAANSTNQAEYCIKLVNKMPFKSADAAPAAKNETADLVFYDVEVFPNLFLVNWKFAGSAQPVVRMINPTSEDIEGLMKFRLIGFNCRRYDNHILYLDITAPLYWWKEFDTYKVGTVANSCSTMHKIADKPFKLDDFSNEHLMAFPEACEFMGELDENIPDEASLNLDVSTFKNRSNLLSPWFLFTIEVQALNQYRNLYLRIKNKPTKDLKKKEENLKKIWWQMIQLLPSSYNQKRTVMLNYEVLANIYKSRRHHKLDEWHTLCDWIESLPYSKLITGTAV